MHRVLPVSGNVSAMYSYMSPLIHVHVQACKVELIEWYFTLDSKEFICVILHTDLHVSFSPCRPSKVTSPPSQSMEPFSSSTHELVSSSSRSSTPVCGRGRNVLDSWRNGRRPRKWLLSLDLCQWRNNPNRSLSLGRACWTHWRCEALRH